MCESQYECEQVECVWGSVSENSSGWVVNVSGCECEYVCVYECMYKHEHVYSCLAVCVCVCVLGLFVMFCFFKTESHIA